MIKNIIIIILVIIFIFFVFPPVLGESLKNIESSINYEIIDNNLIIYPSNQNHKYRLIAFVGRDKKEEKIKLEKHNDHLMAVIPKNSKKLELKNDSTHEFFTLKIKIKEN